VNDTEQKIIDCISTVFLSFSVCVAMLIILASAFSFFVPFLFKMVFPFLKWLTILAVVSSVLNLVMNRPNDDEQNEEEEEEEEEKEKEEKEEKEDFTAPYPPSSHKSTGSEGKKKGKTGKKRKSGIEGGEGSEGGATIAHKFIQFFTHGYRPKRSAKQVKRDKQAEERYLKELRVIYNGSVDDR